MLGWGTATLGPPACSGAGMSISRRKLTPLLAGAAVALCAACFALGAAPAGAKPRVLGAASPVPASCPENCLVEARTTGFQRSIDGRRSPFVVPRAGRVVAWSIKLGSPTKHDRRFFNEEFGGSKARLSILKPVRGKKRKLRYRLVRQSPMVKLAPFFGEIATFSLHRALQVRKGQIVALTIPTWAPSFAAGMSDASRWTASRTPKKGGCYVGRGAANVNAGAAQLVKGSERPYRCTYRGSRLLYSARFVRNG